MDCGRRLPLSDRDRFAARKAAASRCARGSRSFHAPPLAPAAEPRYPSYSSCSSTPSCPMPVKTRAVSPATIRPIPAQEPPNYNVKVSKKTHIKIMVKMKANEGELRIKLN